MKQELQLKILSGDKLNPTEKLEAVKGLVSKSIEKILLEKIILAKAATQQKVQLTLYRKSETDKYETVEQFLKILDCKVLDMKVYTYEEHMGSIYLEFSV